MSLISEALKRKQIEKNEQAATQAPATPATPAAEPAKPPVIIPAGLGEPSAVATPPPAVPSRPAMKPRPVPPVLSSVAVEPAPGAQEKAGTPAWLSFSAISLVIVLLLAGAIFSCLYAYRYLAANRAKAAGRNAVAAATEAPLPPAPEPAPVPVEPPPPPEVQAPDGAPEVAVVAPLPGATEAAGAHDATAKPASVPVAKPPETAAAVPVAASGGAHVVWPRLAVSGLVGSKKAGAAIVNGEIVGLMETVANAQVIALSKDGVTFEYQGETRSVRIGGTIE